MNTVASRGLLSRPAMPPLRPGQMSNVLQMTCARPPLFTNSAATEHLLTMLGMPPRWLGQCFVAIH